MKFSWKSLALLAIFLVVCLVETDAQAKQKVSKKKKHTRHNNKCRQLISGSYDFNRKGPESHGYELEEVGS